MHSPVSQQVSQPHTTWIVPCPHHHLLAQQPATCHTPMFTVNPSTHVKRSFKEMLSVTHTTTTTSRPINLPILTIVQHTCPVITRQVTRPILVDPVALIVITRSERAPAHATSLAPAHGHDHLSVIVSIHLTKALATVP